MIVRFFISFSLTEGSSNSLDLAVIAHLFGRPRGGQVFDNFCSRMETIGAFLATKVLVSP